MHTLAAKIAAHKIWLMLALTAIDGVQTHIYQQKFKGLPPQGQIYYSGGLRRVSPGRPCDLNPLIGCHPIGFEVSGDAILALALKAKHVKHADAFVWGVIIEEGAAVTWNTATWDHHQYNKPDGLKP